MKAEALYKAIRRLGGTVGEDTVDTCKAGDLSRNVQKLAVCFIATPRVIKQAAAWGADMILTHEPTFYTNDDTADTDAVTLVKQQLIAEHNIVICRFHDGMHTAFPDPIAEGLVKQASLSGEMCDSVHFRLEESMTARELATLLKVRCGLSHVRLIGAPTQPISMLGLYLGAPDGNRVMADLKSGQSDCIVIGEVCEWSIGEYVRDAAQLGFARSMIILGHVGAERDGMRLLADRVSVMFPSVETQYFESEEIYMS